jgi:hypothetical protein
MGRGQICRGIFQRKILQSYWINLMIIRLFNDAIYFSLVMWNEEDKLKRALKWLSLRIFRYRTAE